MNDSDLLNVPGSRIRAMGKDVAIRWSTGMAANMLLFGASVIFGRFLGPELYGTLVLATTVISFFTILSDPGLAVAMPRCIPRARAEGGGEKLRAYLVSGIVIKMLFTVVMAAAMLLSAKFVAGAILRRGDIVPYIYAGFPMLIGVGFVTYFLAMIQGFEKWAQEGAARIFEKSVYVGLLLAVALCGKLTIGLSIAAQYAGAFAGVAALMIMLARNADARLRPLPPFQAVADKSREMLAFGLPVVGGNLLYFLITWLDRMFIGRYRVSEEVAYYHLAVLFITFATFFIEAQRNVLMPVFSRRAGVQRLDDEMNARTVKLFRWFTHFSVVVSIGLYFISAPVIIAFYGGAYTPAILAVRLFLPVYIIRALSTPLYLSVVGTIGNTSVTFWSQCIWVAVNVIFNFMLVPNYGFRGAIAATTLSYIVSSVYTFVVCRRAFGVRFPALLFLKAGAVLCGLYFFFTVFRMHWLPGLVLASGVYLAVLYALGEIRREDIDLYRQLLPGRKDRL